MVEKALFFFFVGATRFGVFSGEFVQGGGIGCHAGALSGPAREAYEAAKAAHEAAKA